MKSVAFLSLLSLAAAAVVDQRDESCAAPSSTITSTVTVAAAAASTAAALDVCSGEPETITSTVTVTSGATGACTIMATTVLATDAASISASLVSSAATASITVGATTAVDGVNVQLFTGKLGGPAPPVVSGTGTRPFTVNGNTFVGSGAAIGRSCDIQHNACANAANSGALTGGVGQCDTQGSECRAFNNLRKRNSARTFENFHVIRRNNKNHKGNKGVNAAAAVDATATESVLATGTVSAVVMSITSCA